MEKVKNIKTKLKKHIAAFSILLVSLGLTLLATYYTSKIIESQAKEEYYLVCNEIKTKITTRLNAHAQILRSGAALFFVSDTVSRHDWKKYIEGCKIKYDLPGIQGVGYSIIIPKEHLQNHIQNVRDEGFPEYMVKPTTDRENYTAIIYLEPFDYRNQRAFGYDMFSESVRRKAMEQARDLDIASLTGKVLLVQETDEDLQAGTLMYVPVYQKNKPISTIEERRLAIKAWIYSPYRMTDLMEGILGYWDDDNDNRIQLRVYDNSLSLESLLFDSQEKNIRPLNENKPRSVIIPITFNNTKWFLEFIQPENKEPFFQSKSTIVLISGIIISFLIFFLLRTLSNTKFKAKIIADKLTLNISTKNKEYEILNEELNKKNKVLTETKKNLILAKEKAEESDNLKSAFLANMSHEIRTPMNSILGFSDLLKRKNLSDEKKEKYLSLIETGGKRLLTLISDIIDVSKIDANQLSINLSIFNLNELLENLRSQFSIQSTNTKVALNVTSALADDKSFIKTDDVRLAQILSNILENAQKFTQNGQIEFGYTVKGKFLHFFVKDTGKGIEQKNHESIFDRFRQVDNEYSKSGSGTGLGLSIVKGLVNLLDGEIWVESELENLPAGKEGGATFYFTLPYIKAEPTIDTEKLDDKYNFDDEIKLTILVAEDEPSNFIYIEALLEDYPCKKR